MFSSFAIHTPGELRIPGLLFHKGSSGTQRNDEMPPSGDIADFAQEVGIDLSIHRTCIDWLDILHNFEFRADISSRAGTNRRSLRVGWSRFADLGKHSSGPLSEGES